MLGADTGNGNKGTQLFKGWYRYASKRKTLTEDGKREVESDQSRKL